MLRMFTLSSAPSSGVSLIWIAAQLVPMARG
jgi:hypothetical protein